MQSVFPITMFGSGSASVPSSTGQIILGGRTNYGNSGNAENAFIEQIGGNPTYSVLMEYLNIATWGTWPDTGVWDAIGGFAPGFTEWPGPKMIKIPMQVTASPLLWTDVTGGGQDSNFTSYFEWCVTNGVQNQCPGWEGNLATYTSENDSWPWATEGNDSTYNQEMYVAVWQHIWTLADAVESGYFKWWWNPGSQPGGYNFVNWEPGSFYWPGNSYVDVLGLDIYNTWVGSGPFPGDNTMLSDITAGAAPNWNQCLDYAIANNMSLCIPEWGMNGNNTLPNGGDDYAYINNIYGLAVTAATTYGLTVYLMPWNNEGEAAISDGDYPNALNALIADVADGVAAGLIVGPAPSPLTLGTVPAQTATVGTPYSYTLTATGGTPPYTFAHTSSLPGGLSLNATTGVISGTPTTVQSITVNVKVTDNVGNTSPGSFPFAVTNNPVPDAPTTIDGITVPTTLVFRQEFASDGAVDFNYWNVVNGVTDNAALMLASNVSFTDEGVNLNWTANTGSFMTTGTGFNSGAPYDITGPGFTISPGGGGTSSGTGPVYVEWEAMFVPSGDQIANWPALWLAVGQGSLGGEIDVAEGLGVLATTIHYNNYGSQTAHTSLGNGVHTGTFGVLWTTSGQYTVYDGNVVVTNSVPLSEMANEPQCILIENGGGPGGSGGPSVNNAAVVVSYVRVWQGT